MWSKLGRGISLLFVLALGACGPAVPEEELIILHTGRLGGNVYPLADQRPPGTPLQHYPYLAGYIQAVRAEAKERGVPVLLLDSGDSLTGSFASHVTGSRNVVKLFNELGYDLVALGNLDADLDPSVLQELKMPVINPFADTVGRPAMGGTEFWTQIEKGKTVVNVFANFYGDVAVEQFPTRFPMWFGKEPGGVVPIRDYAALAEKAQAKKPGGLNVFHWMKFEGGAEPPKAYLDGLKEVGMDLIVAHRIYSRSKRDVWGQGDFTKWSIPVSENILRRNQGFTVARVDLEKRNGRWRITGQQLKQMTANTAQADQTIIKAIGAFGPEVAAANGTVGNLSRPMSADDILKAYMVALSEAAEATTVVYSPESIRTELDAGPLVASSLFDALPWTSPIVRLTLDDGQAAKLRSSADLVRLERREVEGPVRVVTSRYFGEVLRRELALRPDQIEVLALGSEYEILLAFAKRRGDLSQVQIPENWEYAQAR